MKEAIHPTYPPARVSCACGNSFVTRSTRGDFQVDVCSACHPFYTGTQKLLDTAGRVDRFRKRYEGNAAKVASKVNTGTPKKEKPAKVEEEAAPAEASEPKAD